MLRVGYKPFKTNCTNFSTLKDKTSKHGKCNVVYKIPCVGNGLPQNRCSLCYIGQTGNRLETRMGQHNDDIKKSNDISETSKGQTSLVRHFQDGHAPDFDKVSIIMMEPNDFKRKILESLNIVTNDSMNFRRDTDSISKVYHSLLDVKLSD